jgi:hypothetical protein
MEVLNEKKIDINNCNVAMIYGEIYEILGKLEVDRVYIIQPYPTVNHLYLSVYFEVDDKGVASVKDIFQNVPISESPKFSRDLATNSWLYYENVYDKVKDDRILSMMRIMGTTNVAIKRLKNAKGDWIGSLVVGNIRQKKFDEKFAMDLMNKAAMTIQYILPPINQHN